MIQDRIERDLLIEAPIDVVWRVVTEPEHLNGWFTDACEVDLQPGGDGTMTWGERAAKVDKADGEIFVARLRIERVEPPHRFTYRWGHPDGEAPTLSNSLLVEFTLESEGENTRLYMVESGILGVAWTDDAKQRYFNEHTFGWDTHLPDLREYVVNDATRSA